VYSYLWEQKGSGWVGFFSLTILGGLGVLFFFTLLIRFGVTTFVYIYIGPHQPHLCHGGVEGDSFGQMAGHIQSLSLRRALEMRNNGAAAATASPVFKPSFYMDIRRCMYPSPARRGTQDYRDAVTSFSR
jgi:hypothetical protein